MKPQTVYVPISMEQVNESTFVAMSKVRGQINLKQKNYQYTFSKEELIEFSKMMLNQLREEFLLNTQNYPSEYHKLFEEKYNRAEKRHEQFINNILNQ